MITKKQLSKHLGICERTVDNYRKLGMPYVRTITGRIRFVLEDVEKWIEETSTYGAN